MRISFFSCIGTGAKHPLLTKVPSEFLKKIDSFLFFSIFKIQTKHLKMLKTNIFWKMLLKIPWFYLFKRICLENIQKNMSQKKYLPNKKRGDYGKESLKCHGITDDLKKLIN